MDDPFSDKMYIYLSYLLFDQEINLCKKFRG